MWAAVIFFAFTAAQDPVRIGIVVLLISRPRPLRNVFSYWVGLMVTGFGAALAALFLLHDVLLPVTRAVTSASANPVVPPIQIVLGVLALSTAAMLVAPSSVRQAAFALKPGGDSSVLVAQEKTPGAFATFWARLSWTGMLEGRSLGMAFIAGLCTSTQIVEFWGAMMVILASGKGTLAQVGAALLFTLLAFTIIEIPLLSCLIAPHKTQLFMTQLHDRLRTHRRRILAFMLALMGVMMVSSGIGGV
jgi:hypothetical protein